MGEIQYKKNIELTLEHLNRKKLKRDQRFHQTKRLRVDKKYRKRQVTLRNRNKPAMMMVESGYPGIIGGIKEPSVHVKTEEGLEQRDTLGPSATTLQNANSTIQPLQPPISTYLASEVSESKMGGSEGDVKMEEDGWTAAMDQQLAEVYIYNQNIEEVPRLMQRKHPELNNWDINMFLRKFTKLVKKAIKKVQMESQLTEDNSKPVLNRLSKEEVKRVCRSIKAESVRIKLLSYYLLSQPNLELLYLVVEHTNRFL